MKQGKPEPSAPIHMVNEQPEEMKRKKLLGIETHSALCGNGSFHLNLTRKPAEVTCLACLARIDRFSRGEE